MNVHEFCALLTPSGQEALQAALERQPQEAGFLHHLTALSRHYPPGLARAALETAILRAEAVVKFPLASQMYFTRQALEQATTWQVAAYRARRFGSFSQVADLGCSIGGDTLALAEQVLTLGIDLDPLRLQMARANLQAAGLAERAALALANLNQALPVWPSAHTALFFDPARRIQGARVFSVQSYLPPLSIIDRWLPRFPALGVKISPGVNLDELAGYQAEIEFISLRGELKEAVLWFGPLKTTSRRATLLPGPHSLAASLPDQLSPQRLPLNEPCTWIYEPDPAILRANLVTTLGVQLGLAQLDPDIAYLTSDERKESPFLRAWMVETWFPFNLKRLRETLRQRNVGQVVVKKRGSPLQPEALIRDLRLKGDQERVIFLTHLRGRPIAVLAYTINR